MRTAVHIDHTPGVRPSDIEDKDFLQFRRVNYLKTWGIKESRSSARLATYQRRIQVRPAGAVLVQHSCPRLKRHIRCARRSAEAWSNFPISFLVRGRTEIDFSIGPAGRWFRRRAIFRGGGGATVTAVGKTRHSCKNYQYRGKRNFNHDPLPHRQLLSVSQYHESRLLRTRRVAAVFGERRGLHSHFIADLY